MDKTLARAAKRLHRRDYTAALGLAEEVLARDSQYPAALSLRADVQRAIDDQAANPIPGFSLRTTLSTATVWLRTKAIYSNTFRITAAFVLAVAVAVGVWKGPADAPQSVDSTPADAPATAGDPPTAAPKSNDKPPSTGPAAVTPSTKGGVDVSPMVVDARRHLGTGDLVAAARAIVPALAAAPENPDVLKTREEILGAGENGANAAKTNADSSGAQSQREYIDATRHLQSAATARRSGRSEDVEPAVREYASAAELYRKALTSKSNVAQFVKSATALTKKGNYSEAARMTVEGLKLAPGNADLLGTMQQALDAAKDSADRAKQAAELSGASSQGEYVDAGTRLKSAVSAGASDRAEDKASAVEHYVTAAQKYIDSVNSYALAMFKQGKLGDATRAVTTGLAATPGHADLRKTLQEILDAAEAGATAAKRSADVVAGASSRSEYANATSRLGSAGNYRRSGRLGDAEEAVRAFGAAEKLFRDAAAVATPPPSPPPPVGVGPIVNTAKDFIAQGNLIGAARAIVNGLEAHPKNSDLLGTLDRIYDAANAEANNARNAADAAGAKDRPEYDDADERHQTARRSSRTVGAQNAEAIVREFGVAAGLYRTAAAKVKTVPGPDPRAIDEQAIRKLLSDFVEAYNSMDVRRVRRFKPSFTGFPRDVSSAAMTLSNILIGPIVGRQTATVTLAVQYRYTFRKGAVPDASAPRPVNLTWRVQRKDDAWILLE
jgi:tetratricopeptide (TPR) repeat protein